MEVSWESPFPAAGYRVYYNKFAVPDMEKWQSVQIGPYTVMEINGLEPHTAYAVRVCGMAANGRYGNLSEAIITNQIQQG